MLTAYGIAITTASVAAGDAMTRHYHHDVTRRHTHKQYDRIE